jgi:hypothetical protein
MVGQLMSQLDHFTDSSYISRLQCFDKLGHAEEYALDFVECFESDRGCLARLVCGYRLTLLKHIQGLFKRLLKE